MVKAINNTKKKFHALGQENTSKNVEPIILGKSGKGGRGGKRDGVGPDGLYPEQSMELKKWEVQLSRA